MGMTTVNSLHALLEASNDALSRAHDAGVPAVLVVPSHSWGQQRKLQMCIRDRDVPVQCVSSPVARGVGFRYIPS